MFRATFLSLLCASSLFAQDGEELYNLYCSACHGADGQGATGGQFPPLADSEWVSGDPARSAKIILHGLHGEIEVSGSTFNLDMPPQGSVLADDQIAAILTYVRSSWGNQDEPVTPASIEEIRSTNTDRKNPWTAEELLKLHPLPAKAPPIANLTSQVYRGKWQTLPDFSKLEAENIEEENEGLISLKKAGYTDHFGIVWQGEITAPESGEFTFRMDADDGARVIVDGQEVVEVAGTGPMDGSRVEEGTIQLEAGTHKLRVEYFEFEGYEGIAIAWKGPGLPSWEKLTDSTPQARPEPLMITPGTERATIYRNFIAGTTPRAIGIGFPGGLNLTYSADHFAPELIWTGDFMEGTRHWTDRGQGAQPPAGERIVKLSSSPIVTESARFHGYKLDPAGNPAFSVQLGKRYLLDSWRPPISADSHALIRTLNLRGQGGRAELLIVEGHPIHRISDNEYIIAEQISLRSRSAAMSLHGQKLMLTLSPGQTAELTYRWK